MSDDVRFEKTSHRRIWWGPAHTVSRRHTIEVTVGDRSVELDMTDRRSAVERQADKSWWDPFAAGVLVRLDGDQVATVSYAEPRRAGLIRRTRLRVDGDDRFVPAGMEFTHRALPMLLTLRDDSGTLAASRRWAGPLNTALVEWLMFREYDLIPPRVDRRTRPEHIAFWLAMRQARTT